MKTALVVGCASNVWDDVREAQKLTKFDAVYCVKMAGIFWPDKFDVWATLHPEWMGEYENKRKANGYPDGYEWVAPLKVEVGRHAKHEPNRRVSYRYPGMNASASSGMYAAKIALEDGFNRVVLAGVPMQAEQNHFERKQEWRQCGSFLLGLENCVPHMLGKVKSMSGLTKELLGHPTPTWIAGEPQ